MDLLADSAKGSRTLLEVLDYKVRLFPDKVYASVANGYEIQDGFRDVTFEEIHRAVNAMAFWLEDGFGKSTSFETLLYVGVHDLRYQLIFFAAQKCGLKTLLMSPTNAMEHNVALLQDTACTKCCYSAELRPFVETLASKLDGLQRVEMPLWTQLREAYEKDYPFSAPFVDSEMDPVLVLHSSGSTGRPKPVVINNGALATLDRLIQPPPGRYMGGLGNQDYLDEGSRTFCSAPPYHFSSFMSLCVHPILKRSCTVLGPAQRSLTPSLVKEIIEKQSIRLLSASPSVIEAIYHIPGGKETLESLQFISYTGGPLSPAVGDGLSNSVCIAPGCKERQDGSTETGGMIHLRPERADWQYLEQHPDYPDHFEPVMDGVYELVYRDDGKLKPPLMYRYTQPQEMNEYRTKDLFVPHPTKPCMWRFYGRRDDVLVLGNGLKMNPLPLELAVTGHPGVSGALVVGQGKPRPALLVESTDHVVSERQLVNALWPVVQQANASLEEGIRLEKNMIKAVEPGSLIRAPKGTVVRRKTTEKFEGFIESIYPGARE